MRTVALKRIALGILCLAALVACGADKTVTDKERGFEITLPEAWTIDDQVQHSKEPHSMRAVRSTDNAQVTVGVLPYDGTLEDFLSMFDRGTRVAPKENPEVTVGGVKAYKFTGARENPGKNVAVETEMYILMANRRAYVVTLTAIKGDFANYAKEFDAIVKSFKLIEAK